MKTLLGMSKATSGYDIKVQQAVDLAWDNPSHFLAFFIQ